MVAFNTRMPAGIPGDITRAWAANVEPVAITPSGTTGAPTAYGIPVVIDATSGLMRMMTAGDTAVYGVYVRPFPTNSGTDGTGTSTPPTGQVAGDILVSGYISVILSGSTAAVKGGQVYIWTAAASGTHIVGGFEASSPGGSGITFTNAYFMGPADSNNIVEIAFRV